MSVIDRQKKLKDTQPIVQKQTPYQRLYDLKENPFSDMAMFTPSEDDPRRNGTIYDPQFRIEEEKQFFNLFVQPSTGDKPLRLGFVRLNAQAGGRGNGKSTFLNKIMERVNDQSWEDWSRNIDDPALFALAVHLIPDTGKQKSFWQFIQLIFTSLSYRGLLKDIDKNFRAAVFLALISEEMQEELEKKPENELDAYFENHESFLELLDIFSITLPAFTEEAE